MPLTSFATPASAIGRATSGFSSTSGQRGFPWCDGFDYIICTDPIPSRVANPSQGSRRLDFCLQFAANFGAPPADEFCRRKGFGSAFFFQGDAEPSGVATQTIGSNQVCNPAAGQRCHGYQKIVCQ